MKFRELINTYKYMLFIFKASINAIKTNNPAINKYKQLLKKISKSTIPMLKNTFIAIYNPLMTDAIQHAENKNEITISKIISAIIALPITLITFIIYIIGIILLYNTYIIWKQKLKHIKSTKNNDDIIDI